MSSKKVQQPGTPAEPQPVESLTQPAETVPEPVPVVTPAEKAPEVSPAIVELQNQLAAAQSQVAEYKDGWQRSVAEFQNYRRRVEAEKAETYQLAVANILKRYLAILDDMERAMNSRPANLAWADGIELICRKLQSILEAEGLKRIEAVGQKFDPSFHEAVGQEPVEGLESGTVIAVIRNGYMLGEHVIRPAQVRVAQ
jgi:molecular chaperone GrpE